MKATAKDNTKQMPPRKPKLCARKNRESRRESLYRLEPNCYRVFDAANQTRRENKMASKLGEMNRKTRNVLKWGETWHGTRWTDFICHEITLFQYYSTMDSWWVSIRCYHGLRFLCQPRRSCMAPAAAQLAWDMKVLGIGWHRLKVFKQPGGL